MRQREDSQKTDRGQIVNIERTVEKTARCWGSHVHGHAHVMRMENDAHVRSAQVVSLCSKCPRALTFENTHAQRTCACTHAQRYTSDGGTHHHIDDEIRKLEQQRKFPLPSACE
jgi:hypothetical protein